MDALGSNLAAWMAQTTLLTAIGAALPILFRAQHPRAQLLYGHALLAVCLLLPLVQPWRHERLMIREAAVEEPVTPAASAADAPVPAAAAPRSTPQFVLPARQPSRPMPFAWASTLLWILAVGALARVGWLLTGLWQIRRYRIAATPLYPIPESVRAASAITHADAVFCLSTEIAGPVMLGWLAPVVLLPESFVSLGEEAQCAIACHEMLHVRRSDWAVTLLEELAGALLWFNPGAWMLLAQTRLAREELVDAETVRLTSAREAYLEALLAIARGRQLDLAPAPLFLRRRHLTQRMHALLREVSVSKTRLFASYGSMSALLAGTAWFVFLSFPLTGQPQLIARATLPRVAAPSQPATAANPGPLSATAQAAAPPPAEAQPPLIAFQSPPRGRVTITAQPVSSVAVPPDLQEPVTGGVQIASEPAARAAALSLLERARENGLNHRPGTPPYRLVVAFSAGGSALNVGSGQLTENWLSGQKWRWTATLGSYSTIRVRGGAISTGETKPGVVPSRVQMLRNAILWSMHQVPQRFQVRTAVIQWQGRPTTCVLVSGVVAPAEQTRLWEEEEYCLDDVSGVIQVHSIAPGIYTVYGYTQNQQFHGRSTPDRITIYAGGSAVVDAQVSLTDLGAVDGSEFLPTPEMAASGPPPGMDLWGRFPLNVANPSVSGAAKPVIVHAAVDSRGEVLEAETLAASDPALAQPALEVVKSARFPATGNQRQDYINVRFVPGQ